MHVAGSSWIASTALPLLPAEPHQGLLGFLQATDIRQRHLDVIWVHSIERDYVLMVVGLDGSAQPLVQHLLLLGSLRNAPLFLPTENGESGQPDVLGGRWDSPLSCWCG